MDDSNVIPFPVAARITAWPLKNYKVTIVTKGGKRIEQFEPSYLASMDLIRNALQEFPDAIRISVSKQS